MFALFCKSVYTAISAKQTCLPTSTLCWAPWHRPGTARSLKVKCPCCSLHQCGAPRANSISGHGRCSARHPPFTARQSAVNGKKVRRRRPRARTVMPVGIPAPPAPCATGQPDHHHPSIILTSQHQSARCVVLIGQQNEMLRQHTPLHLETIIHEGRGSHDSQRHLGRSPE